MVIRNFVHLVWIQIQIQVRYFLFYPSFFLIIFLWIYEYINMVIRNLAHLVWIQIKPAKDSF